METFREAEKEGFEPSMTDSVENSGFADIFDVGAPGSTGSSVPQPTRRASPARETSGSGSLTPDSGAYRIVVHGPMGWTLDVSDSPEWQSRIAEAIANSEKHHLEDGLAIAQEHGWVYDQTCGCLTCRLWRAHEASLPADEQ